MTCIYQILKGELQVSRWRLAGKAVLYHQTRLGLWQENFQLDHVKIHCILLQKYQHPTPTQLDHQPYQLTHISTSGKYKTRSRLNHPGIGRCRHEMITWHHRTNYVPFMKKRQHLNGGTDKIYHQHRKTLHMRPRRPHESSSTTVTFTPIPEFAIMLDIWP